MKMMTKMGWTKDKGLGANEDGQKEFIKIRFKDNTKGVGFQDKDDQWTEHEDQFNSLLQNLAEPVAEKKRTVESLEEMSKKSRARVHYKKFTRGKDISQYSAKDLANIFGKKSLDGSSAVVEEKPNQIVVGGFAEELKFGVETYQAPLSSHDYFKNKLKMKRASSNQVVEEENTKSDNLPEERSVQEITSVGEKKREKRKNKRKLESNEEDTSKVVKEPCSVGLTIETEDIIDLVDSPKKKRKRDKKQEEEIICISDEPEKGNWIIY